MPTIQEPYGTEYHGHEPHFNNELGGEVYDALGAVYNTANPVDQYGAPMDAVYNTAIPANSYGAPTEPAYNIFNPDDQYGTQMEPVYNTAISVDPSGMPMEPVYDTAMTAGYYHGSSIVADQFYDVIGGVPKGAVYESAMTAGYGRPHEQDHHHYGHHTSVPFNQYETMSGQKVEEYDFAAIMPTDYGGYMYAQGPAVPPKSFGNYYCYCYTM